MKTADIKKTFISEFYGTRGNYLKARKDDYCKVQLEWAFYIDSLCRDGEITEKQYNNATF